MEILLISESKTKAAKAFGLFNIELTPATSTNVWKTAIERQLQEQGLINNMAGDVVKAVTRVWGWLVLELLLYQGENLLTVSRRRRRRKRSTSDIVSKLFQMFKLLIDD